MKTPSSERNPSILESLCNLVHPGQRGTELLAERLGGTFIGHQKANQGVTLPLSCTELLYFLRAVHDGGLHSKTTRVPDLCRALTRVSIDDIGCMGTRSDHLMHFTGARTVKGSTGTVEPFEEDRIVVGLDGVVRLHMGQERGPEIHLPEDSGLGEAEE
jgi:hypothetical protein